jgi:hypothetical protein
MGNSQKISPNAANSPVTSRARELKEPQASPA